MSDLFKYVDTEPCVLSGWLNKSSSAVVQRWHMRFCRLQGPCLYFFKKEEHTTPSGLLPLWYAEVSDILPRKGKSEFGFEVAQTDKKIQLIAVDRADRTQWKRAIMDHKQVAVMGMPLNDACKVTFNGVIWFRLVPVFLRELLAVIDKAPVGGDALWSSTPKLKDVVTYTTTAINKGVPLGEVDAASGSTGLLMYLKGLPHSLLPVDPFLALWRDTQKEKSNANESVRLMECCLRDVITARDAITREVLRLLCLHWHGLVSSGRAVQCDLLKEVKDIVLRTADGQQTKEFVAIQCLVVNAMIAKAPEIVSDVHQLAKSRKGAVVKKARLKVTLEKGTLPEQSFAGVRGNVVNVVRQDPTGWQTVVANEQSGLVRDVDLEYIDYARTGGGIAEQRDIDSLMDRVRAKRPRLLLLFESMLDEVKKMHARLNSS